MLELLLDAALYAFCAVDMRRPHLRFLGATDASASFGLGATVAPMSCSDLRRIARLSCKAGGHVMMEGGPSLPERPSRRLGPRHDLGLNLGDFRVVLSIRRGSPDHVNLEEARALIQYVQWILRTRRHFGHRLVVLLDSKVAIGAVTKGRSSSLPLNRLLRRLAALCFVGGLVLHCVFVPTSHNLADWPSRGAQQVGHVSYGSLRGRAAGHGASLAVAHSLAWKKTYGTTVRLRESPPAGSVLPIVTDSVALLRPSWRSGHWW